MESQEEPDYDAIWRRIVADAEAHAEAWQRQARWLEESGRAFSPDQWEAVQRVASKAFVRQQIQLFDLAEAINQGDIGRYIDNWYPQTTANGPSITFVHYDECELVANVLYGAPNPRNPAALWRKFAARRRTQRQLEASQAAGYYLSTWSVGEGRVGPRPSLREWARRVLRRR